MKMIILDRDGVINHDSPAFIKSPAEWVPIPGSLEAIARLNQAGYRVVVASNQSGIARELFDMCILNAILVSRGHPVTCSPSSGRAPFSVFPESVPNLRRIA